MFHVLTGDGWPAVDEDEINDLAQLWLAAGRELMQIAPEVTAAARWLADSGALVGDAQKALAQSVALVTGDGDLALEKLAAAYGELGNYLHGVAVQTQYMKIIVIEELIILAAQILYLLAMIPWTFGASAAGIAALQAFGWQFAGAVLKQLVIAVATGEVLQLGLDAIAQFAQIMERQTGHSIGRTAWDKNLTASAAITGAIGGALGPIMQGLGHYPTKALGHALGGVLGKNAGHEAGHWAGETIKGAAHEWLTDGMSGAAQHQGWNPDPFSTTAGALDEGISGAAGLGGRKGGHRYYRGMLGGNGKTKAPGTGITIPDRLRITGSQALIRYAHGPQTPPLTRIWTPEPTQPVIFGRNDTGQTISPPTGPPVRDAGASPITDHTSDQLSPAWSVPDTTWWTDVFYGSPQEPAPLPDGVLPPDPVTTAPPTILNTDPSSSEPPPGQLPPTETPPSVDPAPPSESPAPPAEAEPVNDQGFTQAEVTWLLSLLESPQQQQVSPPDAEISTSAGAPPWADTSSWADASSWADTSAWTDTTGADTIDADDPWAQIPQTDITASTDTAWVDLSEPDTPYAHIPPPGSPSFLPQLLAEPGAAQGLPDLAPATPPGMPGSPGRDVLVGPEDHLVGTDPVQPGGPVDAVTGPDLHAASLTLHDPALDPQTRDESLAFLLRLADQPAALAAWSQWHESPQLAGTFPSLLALSALDWTAEHRPGEASSSENSSISAEESAFRQELERTVIAALWRQVAGTAAEHSPGVQATDTAIAHLIAEELPAQASPAGENADLYDQTGVRLTAALARAFVDQTLRATAAGAPELVAGIRQAHLSAANSLTTLANLPLGPGASRAQWAAQLSTYAAAVDLVTGGRAWSALRNWLQAPEGESAGTGSATGDDAQARPEGDTTAVDMAMDMTAVDMVVGAPVEPAVLSHPPRISADTRKAVERLFDEAGMGSRDRTITKFLEYWPAKATPIGETSSPVPVDWARQWRHGPQLEVLPELLALAALQRRSYSSNPTEPPKTARRAATDPNPYPAFRAAWGRKVIGAVWHRTERADQDQPREDHAYPDPARTVGRIADVLASRDAPGGEAHNTPGVAVTSALAQAFLDQTLQAVQAVEASAPDLVAEVRKAHATASSDLAKLSSPRSILRTSPKAWADRVTRFVADVNEGAGSQVWAHLRDRLPEPAVPWLPAAPSLPPAPRKATNQTRNAADQTRDRSAETTGWEERDQVKRILSDPWLDPRIRDRAKQRLREWSGKTGQPDGAPWAPWRANWTAEGTFASVLTLALLHWPEQDKPGHQRLREIRKEHERIALATLWRQVQAAAAARGDRTGPADPTADAQRTAAEITEVAPTTGHPARYNRSGYLPTGGLARAFVEQTLEAVEAAAPDLTTAALVDHVRKAHRTALSRMTILFDGPAHAFRAQWADRLATFVSDIEAADSRAVWTALRDWLQAPRPPMRPPRTGEEAQGRQQGDTTAVNMAVDTAVEMAVDTAVEMPVDTATSPGTGAAADPRALPSGDRPAEPAVLSHPPRISADTRKAVERLFDEAGMGSRDRTITKFLEYWPVKATPIGETSSPVPVDWAQQWRHGPQLAVLPELLALAALQRRSYSSNPTEPPKTARRAATDPNPYPAFRAAWGRAVIAAVWHRTERADPAQPRDDHAYPDPARTVGRIADVIASRDAPGGEAHNTPGVAVTSALAQAFLDQTLQAVQAVEASAPELVAEVRKAHATASKTLARLSSPGSSFRTSPKAWADLVTRFVADVNEGAGSQVWTALRDWLQAPRPPRETTSGVSGTGSETGTGTGTGTDSPEASGGTPSPVDAGALEEIVDDEITILADHRVQTPLPLPGNTAAVVVDHLLPIEIEADDQLQALPEITDDEYREAREILGGPRLEEPARQQAEDLLDRFWTVRSDAVATTAAPGQVAWPRSWPQSWRQGQPPGAGLPSLVALSVLPWPSSDLPDGRGLAEVRDELQRALLGALWRGAETTTPAAPRPHAALPPAVAVAQVAVMVTAQASPNGTRYDEAAVLVTAALTLALLDQTLQAAEAADPGMADPVRQAHRTARTVMSDLLDPTHVNHASPAAWASVPAYFLATLVNRPGTQVWAHLDDRLRGWPPHPGGADLRAAASGTAGAGSRTDPIDLDSPSQDRPTTKRPRTQGWRRPRTTPVEQAPWFWGLLPDQPSAQSPAPAQDRPTTKRPRTQGRWKRLSDLAPEAAPAPAASARRRHR
ncbi:MAG TPA: hypothetical protein VFP72_04185 [Kineosporiaceae bacterium]|nr:hypothetical protein [Kineosporiaceae bacterium]